MSTCVPRRYFEKAVKIARDEEEPVLVVDDFDNGYRVIAESDPLANLYEDEDTGAIVLVVYPDGTTAVPTTIY